MDNPLQLTQLPRVAKLSSLTSESGSPPTLWGPLDESLLKPEASTGLSSGFSISLDLGHLSAHPPTPPRTPSTKEKATTTETSEKKKS